MSVAVKQLLLWLLLSVLPWMLLVLLLLLLRRLRRRGEGRRHARRGGLWFTSDDEESLLPASLEECFPGSGLDPVPLKLGNNRTAGLVPRRVEAGPRFSLPWSRLQESSSTSN